MIAVIVLLFLILTGFVLLGLLGSNDPVGVSFRNSIGSVESAKIALIAI